MAPKIFSSKISNKKYFRQPYIPKRTKNKMKFRILVKTLQTISHFVKILREAYLPYKTNNFLIRASHTPFAKHKATQRNPTMKTISII